MDFPIETVAFVGYLDSLFAEGRAREVTPLRAIPETLNRLHAEAMRDHARPSALLARDDGAWNPTPDWRLDRHVIRVGLYLRERLGVEPGQRVALLSELRPEWLIADLAALGVGAISVAIDPTLQRNDLAAALEDAAPSVTLCSAAAAHLLESLDGHAPPHGQLIALDPAAAGDGIMPLSAVLEMGGTLDTPERAQAYRADARTLAPDRPAVRHYRRRPEGGGGGGWDRIELSQGEVMERLRSGWLREPAHAGDLAYVSDSTVSPAARLAVYAFLGDGFTTTALAPADRALSDLARLHPTKIVAPGALLAEAVRAGLARAEEQPASNGEWLGYAARLIPLAREHRDRRAIREILGGRARWIVSTDPLDSAVAERLATVAVVGPTPR